MMTCLNKYYSADRLIEFFRDEAHRASTFFTLGIKDDEFEKLRAVRSKTDIRFVCVNAANGYTKYFVERVKRIRETFPEMTIMAGNVATPDMVQELLISGARTSSRSASDRGASARPGSRPAWVIRSFRQSSNALMPLMDCGAMSSPTAAVARPATLSRRSPPALIS